VTRQQTFIRFVVVGGTATALQYLVLVILVRLLRIEPWVGSDLGFALSAVYNYGMNRRFTFASNQPHHVTVPRFVVMVLLGAVVNTIIMTMMTAIGLYYLFSQVIATAVVLAVNFFIAASWVFVDNKRKHP
jgi:putative flippase GtrA